MKFGQLLKETLMYEYKYSYVNYDKLKKEIKRRNDQGGWSEEDESDFVELLEKELDKVYSFQKNKSAEVMERIRFCEEQTDEVVRRLDSDNPPNENDFAILETELTDIMATVHDLAKFSELNYTAFYKIIKKHDKHTGWILKPVFAARLNAKPFFKEQYDLLVVKLSKLYDFVRTRGSPIKGDSAAGGTQQNFVRQTTKYWVHPNNVTELKIYILKHLPVLVFNPNKEFAREDAAITSIYYDNDDLDFYLGRLEKREGAEAIRLRWYGNMDNNNIFVERKTHREDWTGEKSVKARFPLKEKYVNAFLRGDYTVEEAFAKMRKDGKKSLKEIESLERLAKEVQYTVLSRGMKPYVRSFYERTAFQLPGDARVRISLDTNLSLIREDGPSRAGNNWRRMDIGIDYPFDQLPDEDIVRFPYAILEVKLQTQFGQDPPEWVNNLVNSHLVEAVPKFSKFIHGVSTLFYDRVTLLPYWFPQMDIDIRKPATHTFIQGRSQSGTHSSSVSANVLTDSENTPIHADGDNYVDEESRIGSSSTRNDNSTFQTSDSFQELDERTNLLDISKRKGRDSFVAALNSRLKDIKDSFFLETVPKFEEPTEPTVIYEQKYVSPPGKRIYVPVRVEPKTYFALERTYLDYLRYSILMGSIGITLFSFAKTRSGILGAASFTLVALFAIFYSTFLYLWRAVNIAKHNAVRYDDRFGPTAICVITFAAISANVILNFNA
ncbi:vacuolar transporter chaperone (VTC) complex subunit Vtc4 [Schizosaccharomyces pombe]|uniref:Vacuolar transporter chaperone complex subunit 4 n=1 Tax=Schizosaccharomyces pombe (strain 972 / ATCC 24843) TaxID=284812 RepID=VTC4_SCHPO|nr:putative transporter chaperone complex subunit vtc4 [Schizosaccharomyces pombe]P78810.2 RecName: Full=Vacuolar transporter chaperone complex subunit 4; AltName: Full=Polyphosphate kinase; AltName: Full=SPX-dependent polyphosphate polymerase VTC subunit 4; AltName: Full=Vacuolar membrane polyphosphate polymerase catalytic subunit; Short=PolyP polymerase [Schizosaccharomyces pombe 972h-]CAA22867.1 vacuolar transporter chaperone (VTC) complex subunit (predicted) [Schizosaccharomyces pombe]|eukprot:NP_588142.1 putative transporter chaperone complex subunit vtc4 [Schizosaccharomyces pombe]